MAEIAFLGLGIMGRPMAACLARAGHAVRGWNRNPRDLDEARAAGVSIAGDAAEAVRGADLTVLMVSTGDAADAVLFGPAGIADALRPGSTVVVMSSIPPDVARRQAERLAPLGVSFIDAPVSGGEIGAQQASLAIMAGGDAAVVKAARPVLEAMGRVTHVGPVGAGQVAKLANQTIVGIGIAAVAEALLLARAGGADPAAVIAALSGGFADSTILRVHGARMVAGDFRPGGHATTQLKDLATARGLADAAKVTLPTLSLVRDLFDSMCADGLGAFDHSGLYAWLDPSNPTPAISSE
ncbi:NAD(P)-dependent oxidoreductase [Sphingomonas canadensis]|uniref:NAD(P)-dependent oxidoreductase n=1 Tax=Sphingomonas canadensis TaxID=1219257 RepID=A0ABW3HDG9_9SPHN|nr:NAD(P)-dependent oxidoreductase [Sphingomonas canadensis]MCW3836966.1 NAD(P)-dependent oxidoreductase [Sphingomonas canadensis]